MVGVGGIGVLVAVDVGVRVFVGVKVGVDVFVGVGVDRKLNAWGNWQADTVKKARAIKGTNRYVFIVRSSNALNIFGRYLMNFDCHVTATKLSDR